MVVTDDAMLADRLRSVRNLCFQPKRRFLHEELGHNFRLTNLQAAVGLGQLERMDEIVKHKRWMGAEYTRRLSGARGIQLPVEEPWARSVWWMYGLLGPADLADRLKARGVETRPFFLGMHEQPALRRRGLFGNERYPVAERLAREGLYLPSGTALTEPQLADVCATLREILA